MLAFALAAVLSLAGCPKDASLGSVTFVRARSASLAADGVAIHVAPAHGGPAHALGVSPAYGDYVASCGGGLVFVGSVSCSRDGRSVAVLSQPASGDASFFSTRWQLWRVGSTARGSCSTRRRPASRTNRRGGLLTGDRSSSSASGAASAA